MSSDFSSPLATPKLLQDVLALALEAGKKVMQIYESGDKKAQSKADQSPLTAADLISHHTIVAGLQQLTPGVPVLSEEASAISFATRQHWTHYWLIDPLDGTKEFIKHNGEFTVNIALMENGLPVLGVVHAPALGLSYFAARGTGAFRQQGDRAPLPVNVAQRNAHEPLKIVMSRSHGDSRQDEFATYLGAGDLLSMGSSLKLCLVADGSAHLYPRPGPTMEWDIAAAHCIVLEAGGRVCDNHGDALHYNKPDLHNPPFVVLAATDDALLEKIIHWGKTSLSTQL